MGLTVGDRFQLACPIGGGVRGCKSEEFLRSPYALQSIPAKRHDPVCATSRRLGEGRGDDHVLIEGTAHRLDPAHFVYGRTADREVKPVLAADVSVEDLSQMEPDVELRRRQCLLDTSGVEVSHARQSVLRGAHAPGPTPRPMMVGGPRSRTAHASGAKR